MAVRFDTGTDRLQKTSGVINYNAAYTWMAWVYHTTLPAAYGTHFIVQSAAGGANSADYFQVDSQGTHHFEWGLSIANSFTSRTTTATVSTGTWYHVALVRASATSLQGYVNGAADGAAITVDISARASVSREDMGAYGASSDPLNGRIAYCKMFNRALSAAEVLNEMRAIRPVHPSSVWAFYPLWPNARARDYSGNGRDWTEAGTLTDEDPPPISWGASASWLVLVPAAGGGGEITGTSALTIQKPSLAASGTETFAGTIALAIQKPSLAASGLEAFAASGALSIQKPSLAASGLETFAGSAAISILKPSIASSGALTFIGTATITIARPSLAGVGTTGDAINGTATLTIQRPGLAASGLVNLGVSGSGGISIARPSLAASGILAILGTATLTIDAPGLSASGTVILAITGTGAIVIARPSLAGSQGISIGRTVRVRGRSVGLEVPGRGVLEVRA